MLKIVKYLKQYGLDKIVKDFKLKMMSKIVMCLNKVCPLKDKYLRSTTDTENATICIYDDGCKYFLEKGDWIHCRESS